MPTYNGTPGNDSIVGTSGDDQFIPGGGNDTFDGAGGTDTITMDLGLALPPSNRWMLTATNSTGTSGTLGDDPGTNWRTNFVTFSNVENISLTAAGAIWISGQLLTGAGSIQVNAMGGNDSLTLLLGMFTTPINLTVAGSDLVMPHGTFSGFEQFGIALGSGDDIANGGEGNDSIGGYLGNDQIFGHGGADFLVGDLGNDTIDGGNGNDQIFGNDGVDVLHGGAGDDLIYGFSNFTGDTEVTADQLFGDAGNDQLVAGVSDKVDGGDGYDILSLDLGYLTVGVTIDFNQLANGGTATFGTGTIAGIEAYGNIYTTQGNDNITIGSALVYDPNGVTLYGHIGHGNGISLQGGNDIANGGLGDDRIDGGDGNDTISGLGGNDNLFGGNGDDTLGGNDGNDFLDGYLGRDTIFGGVGNDFIDGGGDADHLYGEDGDDMMIGSYGADVLVGGAGNDTFDLFDASTPEVDSAYGGPGDDTYQSVDSIDLIFEQPGEGTDTILATNFYLPANVEILDMRAVPSSTPGSSYGVGNSLANTIFGSETSNLLLGGGGDDILNGLAGDDSIYGQDGDDTLNGDAGVDYLVGGLGNDTMRGGDGTDALYGEDGNDYLDGGTTFDTDILIGGNGDDILHGDSGLGDYDFLYGNAGNDTFYVDTPADLVFEQVGEGTDTVYANIAGAGFYMYNNIENCVLLGTTPFVAGNASDNVLTGSDSANWLLGNDGNDTLNGKGGNDVLFGDRPGGTVGHDTFVFDGVVGQDVIGDFHHGEDTIRLIGSFADFAATVTHFRQVGGDCALDLPDGSMIIFQGLQYNTLTAADFLFG